MKKFIAITTAILSLSACVAPIDGTTGAVVVPVPVPVNVPIVITEKEKEKKKDDSIYVCKIQAFTSTYTSENTNRGKARLDVKKKCTANYDEMFCRDTDIDCTEYK